MGDRVGVCAISGCRERVRDQLPLCSKHWALVDRGYVKALKVAYKAFVRPDATKYDMINYRNARNAVIDSVEERLSCEPETGA